MEDTGKLCCDDIVHFFAEIFNRKLPCAKVIAHFWICAFKRLVVCTHRLSPSVPHNSHSAYVSTIYQFSTHAF